MVVLVRANATTEQRTELLRLIASRGAIATPSIVHSCVGEVVCVPNAARRPEVYAELAALPAVDRILPITAPYQLASRELCPQKTIVQVGQVQIGATAPVIIAGPCSVEGEVEILEAAQAAHDAGAHLLRGGAFKPRTSPYSFQGLGLAGLELLAHAGETVGLPVVTEVMEPELVPAVAAIADMLQIGSRNMQNYPLLRAAGRSQRPVLLKRGFAATIEEWLLAAEYILAEGNPNVILCERGVRSFDPMTRNLLDLSCVPLLNQLTHLPIIVDPSHGTGRRELVAPMGIAAIAAGADGLIIEMHPHPDSALSDGDQTITPSMLREISLRSQVVRTALLECERNEDVYSRPPEEFTNLIQV